MWMSSIYKDIYIHVYCNIHAWFGIATSIDRNIVAIKIIAIALYLFLLALHFELLSYMYIQCMHIINMYAACVDV